MTLLNRPSLRFASFALVFALFGCASSSPQKTQTPDQEPVASDSAAAPVGTLAAGEPVTPLSVEADDARLGSDTAAVTIVGFLDFECSFCAQGFATLMQLREKYDDSQLRIVFKHLPLEFHPQALPAAVVGQAVTLNAGSEAFFKFAHAAFEGQADINFQSLAKWAEEAGLSREAYNQSVGERSTMERVVQDAIMARQSGVDGTPAFFVNGELLAGAQPVEVFTEVIERELAAMKGASGEKWAAQYKKQVSQNMSASLVQSLLAEDPDDYKLPIDGSPSTGPKDALLTLVVFSDYECPYCKRADETVKQLRKHYGKQLRVVFKQMPLGFHKSARPAALLAVAVQQTKGDAEFFALSEELFESSPQLDSGTLRKLGKKYGLSAETIDEVLNDKNEAASARLEKDATLADDVLARGTPHFFINGKRLDGARPLEQFQALCDYLLKEAKSAVASGVSAENLYAHLQEDALAPGAPQAIDVEVPLVGQPIRGPENAPVLVHIFSDFECPYCRKGEQLLVELEKKFPSQLRFVWHDFPLPFHKQALPLARAGRAAFKLGGSKAFWKVHDGIFALDEESARLSEAGVEKSAKDAGLNAQLIVKAMNDESYDAAIEADQKFAESIGIRGTPAFIVGDYLVTGAKPLRYLERVVRLSLEKSESAKQ